MPVRLLQVPLLLVFLGTPAAGSAQTSGIASDIAIDVTDETGAHLPGVSVTVTSNTTGISRTLMTAADGTGLAVSLQPGSYAVSAELSGFATVTLSQVTVALNQRANITIQLKVASVAEQITVTGESSRIVDTSKTDVSTLVNELAIQELPINERNPLRFILTLPGTTIQRTATGSGYSFGGSRARNNSSILDGADNNDDSIRGFLAQPSLDAVKEFQVMASNFTAEYGRASGGVVNTILKSGTNQIRGSGFYYIRDRSFAANNFFTNANPNNPPGFRPYFRQQQPGGSIGGPLRRNELFFFTSYEHFRTDEFKTVTISPASATIINNVLAGRYDLVPNLGPNFPRGIELGFDKIGGPGEFPFGQRRHVLVEKVDWQASPDVSFFGRYLYNHNRHARLSRCRWAQRQHADRRRHTQRHALGCRVVYAHRFGPHAERLSLSVPDVHNRRPTARQHRSGAHHLRRRQLRPRPEPAAGPHANALPDHRQLHHAVGPARDQDRRGHQQGEHRDLAARDERRAARRPGRRFHLRQPGGVPRRQRGELRAGLRHLR